MKAALAAALALAVVGPVGAQTAYVSRDLPAEGTSICPGGLCGAERLAPFFEGLAALEAGERITVHVVQIGDSHTAGDRITGRMRADLQARFGDGGRGVLPPGVPWAGYAPLQVEVIAHDWTTTLAPLAAGRIYSYLDVGLSGVQQIDTGPDARLILRPETSAGTLLIGLCWEEPWGVRVSDEDEEWLVDVASSPSEKGRRMTCRELRPATPPSEIILRPADPMRPVVMLDHIRLTAEGGGVVVSNLGVVGSTLFDLASRDPEVVADELVAWAPRLIVLAYGTNEGFDDGLDLVAYERLLRDQIDRLRRLAPGAAILILGAPDALRRGEVGACPGTPERGPPRGLARVRDLQRRVAAEAGVAFWDWHGRMGGDCSADRLAQGDEPLMRGDRVHFTAAGGEWLGALLADDLTGAYDAWRAGRGAATAKSEGGD